MKIFQIGIDADVVAIPEDRLREIVRAGRDEVRRARKAGELPPDALRGIPAAMLVALAGFGDAMTGIQWRHLGGIVAGILATTPPEGFRAYRGLVKGHEANAIASDARFDLVVKRVAWSYGTSAYIWGPALRQRQEEEKRRLRQQQVLERERRHLALMEEKRRLREAQTLEWERQRLMLMPAIKNALAWQAAATEMLDRGRAEQRWITTEAVDALTATRPEGRLGEQIRATGFERFLTPAQAEAVAFLDCDLAQLVVQTNAAVMAAEVVTRRQFFDTIEATPLTGEQVRAVVCFDNRVQVLAAAGSGKTSVMVARAAYAVSRGFVSADRILLLAFNRNAAEELQERINTRFAAAGIESSGVRASTFHSFGLNVIGRATGEKPRLAPWLERGDDVKMVENIVESLRGSLDKFRYQWDLYRLLFAQAPISIDERQPDGWNAEKREGGFQTFGGAVVKSHGERLIADFLYLNGVEYEYERRYKHPVATAEHAQYRPDFYYPEIDVWHEHWAVDRDGRPPEAFTNYAEGMEWKRRIHSEYGTSLIETSWAEVVHGNGLADLARKLTDAGVALRWNPDRPPQNEWSRQMKHEDLSRLMRTFMTHIKSNCWTKARLEGRLKRDLRHLAGYRTQLFLDIYWPIHDEWERRLADAGCVDFEDMLVKASGHLEGGGTDMGYDLVMVDEFQDASQARARLVRGLLRRRGRYLLAVGDDWQSINRFAGADLAVMTEFESWFGRGHQLALATTFRCPQTICDVASRFVTRNPAQFKKPMRSARTMPGSPVRIVRSDHPAEALAKYLSELSEKVRTGAIVGRNGGRVVVNVLGRYGVDRDLMPSSGPTNLAVTFRTIHASKGLEADYIVLPNVTAGAYGFPSGIAEDPVLNLSMPLPETFPFAEERRLLYVALTRARQEVTLITSPRRMSAFVAELLETAVDHDVAVVGEEVAPVKICPECGKGALIRRENQYGTFLHCSTWPRCSYKLTLPPGIFSTPDPPTAL